MNDNEYGINNETDNQGESAGVPFNDTETKPLTGEPVEVEAEPVTADPYAAETKTNYGDYSKYCDPVGDEPPRQYTEPQYSPYAEQQYGNSDYAQNYTQTFQKQSYQQAPAPEPKKKKSKGFKGFLIAVAAIVVCVAVLLSIYPKLSSKETVENNSSDSTQLIIKDSSSYGEASTNSIEIAANAQKFNVGILLYGKTQTFGSAASNSLVGEGSGIIMGVDSTKEYTYIVTCAHVISDVKSKGYTMTVQDCDGNTYEGYFVGADTKTDVGVIKIKATGLTAAEFGDSSKLVIGQQVYAIGNPGGVEFFGSFTNGMISAIDRPINSESGYEMKCIQHTTPINSGNSGGALLNEFGQVIGINSSKIVSTGYEGMAFAIPISDAKPIIDDIIANGYVTDRPKLGITYAPASQYREYSMIVALKDLPSGSLIIYSVSEDSDLKNTKAKVGDMIIAVDGEELTSADVLLDKIENGHVGDTLKLTLCRINEDYSIDKFNVDVSLVEDTGNSGETEQQTTTNYWEQFFGSGY